MCNNCIHKAVCSIYTATGGVKKCKHFKEERKGKWKPVDYTAHCSCGKSYKTVHYKCSACNRVAFAQPYGLTFCPNCGADMRGEPT